MKAAPRWALDALKAYEVQGCGLHPDESDPESWVNLLAQTDDGRCILEGINSGDLFVVQRLPDGITTVYVYDVPADRYVMVLRQDTVLRMDDRRRRTRDRRTDDGSERAYLQKRVGSERRVAA
jgi:hypothetical protein